VKLGVLSSSRADYGIYTPLLMKISNDPFFDLSVICFGSHLSEAFGYTVEAVRTDVFGTLHTVDALPTGDTPKDISKCLGDTVLRFASFWEKNHFDLVIALGDRFEMFAAIASLVAFNIPVAHIHGGEMTEGAIDDAFRHSITHMSKYHFASTQKYADRIKELKGNTNYIYNTGALSFDNLKQLNYYTIDQFYDKYKVDLGKPTILITFHPETVGYQKNELYASELVLALSGIEGYQLLITMPNADTMGSVIRHKLNDFVQKNENAFAFESLGMHGYLSAMKHCSFLLGNSSSGCIEASFFPKWVINLGERQRGRVITPNVISCAINSKEILSAVSSVSAKNIPDIIEVFGNGNAAQNIVNILKNIHG